MRREKNYMELMRRDVNRILELKKNGSYDELTEFLIPYPYEGSLFERSRAEIIEELEPFLGKEEAEATADDEAPETAETEELGFRTAFALDWGMKYPEIETADFLRAETAVGRDAGMIFETAKRNLSGRNFEAVPDFSGKSEVPTLLLRYSRRTVPDCSASIIFDDDALGKVCVTMGSEIAVCPYYREAVVATSRETFEKIGKKEFLKAAEGRRLEEFRRFSDRTFLFDGKRMIEAK